LRGKVTEIAKRMTYLELSADNTFYDQFMSALFLPHTDVTAFPSVMRVLEASQNEGVIQGTGDTVYAQGGK
jgi:uncharacterized 2Fe-2S/4Fe-4S cluster protein (DUF4445 family)